MLIAFTAPFVMILHVQCVILIKSKVQIHNIYSGLFNMLCKQKIIATPCTGNRQLQGTRSKLPLFDQY
jgi:hypothetical protein